MDKPEPAKYDWDADPSIAGISNKTIRNIFKVGKALNEKVPDINPKLPAKEKPLVIQLINECIKEQGGEISRQAKVLHLAMVYLSLSQQGKFRFLSLLSQQFDVDVDALDEKIHLMKEAATDADRSRYERALTEALTSPRKKLLRQLINLPNGFIFLKDMRTDVLTFMPKNAKLKKLGDDIKNLLVTYFDVNLLSLQEVTWNSPASLLERIAEYEAVHEIASWKDLKHRLLTDHRVFAFFHYKMPNDPLIFIEVALVKGMSDNIQKLLDVKAKPGDPEQADTAIFYSITSTQKGLDGISFGNFLIKRVVKTLSARFPNLRQFATLSPVPALHNWLKAHLARGGDNLLKPHEKELICALSKKDDASQGLMELVNTPKWYKNPAMVDALKLPLMRLCTHFLINEKRKDGLRAKDPVANFHLTNGAKIEHIHWLADISKKGIAQSFGIMLNYHYRPDKIAVNHEDYMTSGKVHASGEVRKWME